MEKVLFSHVAAKLHKKEQIAGGKSKKRVPHLTAWREGAEIYLWRRLALRVVLAYNLHKWEKEVPGWEAGTEANRIEEG